MSKSLLVAAISSIVPVQHAQRLDSSFPSVDYPILAVRNTLTDFYHILYMQDGEVKNYNVGNEDDFSRLAIAANSSAPNQSHSVDYALNNWDTIVKEGQDCASRYVLAEIKAFNQEQAA